MFHISKIRMKKKTRKSFFIVFSRAVSVIKLSKKDIAVTLIQFWWQAIRDEVVALTALCPKYFRVKNLYRWSCQFQSQNMRSQFNDNFKLFNTLIAEK